MVNSEMMGNLSYKLILMVKIGTETIPEVEPEL